MTLIIQSRMTGDHYLVDRAAASAAALGIVDARTWAARHIWAIVASDGWAEAYGAALTAEEREPADPAAWAPRVGARSDVITDAMVVEAVERVFTQNPAPVPEPSLA